MPMPEHRREAPPPGAAALLTAALPCVILMRHLNARILAFHSFLRHRMQQFVGTSLKTRLYLLVLAAFIPVAGLIIYVAEEQKTIETEAIRHRTMLLAGAAADAEDQQVEATRNLLAALGNAWLAVDGSRERFSQRLATLKAHATGYKRLGIIDPQGRLVAGSDPADMAQNYGGVPWFITSLSEKKLTVGTYQGERIDGEPVIYFAWPIAEEGAGVEAVAFAAFDLNWMNRHVFRQFTELPAGSRLTLLDDDREMLRYDVDAARWSVPPPIDPELRRRLNSEPSGTHVGADENDIPRIYAFARLESAFRQRPIAVVLEMPQSIALAASKRIFIRNIALLALSALMAVLAIWWAADVFILRRINVMVRASRRLAEGDLKVRIGPMGVKDELSHLAGVFDEMAASLQMRIEREAQVMASLEQSREQLRRLSAYQNDVREQDRIRIAREIHDQLGQSLTILKMDLSWLKRHPTAPEGEIAEKMAAMAVVIEGAVETLHAVTAELRPGILDDFGLAAAIDWQAEQFTRRSGIACRLENGDYEPDLPKAQATALFRIFQETLTNIMRHAQASEVVLSLEKRDRELFFEVADNGRGITAEEIDAPDAFGLLGIRERLYPFGGRVKFTGHPGQGTRVAIYLPLPKEGENL